MSNPAAVTDSPPASPRQAKPAPPQGIAVAETARKKPTLFDALGVKKQAAPVEPPGAYDQIQDPIVVENPLARPPWEVFMEAGPNAHKELDLETLYGPGHIPADMQAKEDAEQAEKAAQQTIAERQLAAQQAVPQGMQIAALFCGDTVCAAVTFRKDAFNVQTAGMAWLMGISDQVGQPADRESLVSVC